MGKVNRPQLRRVRSSLTHLRHVRSFICLPFILFCLNFFSLDRILGPVCRNGFLVRKRNSRNGQHFYGCSNYRVAGCKYTATIGNDAASVVVRVPSPTHAPGSRNQNRDPSHAPNVATLWFTPDERERAYMSFTGHPSSHPVLCVLFSLFKWKLLH